MGHIESKGVMLPLDVSCYLWNIMWSLTWHLWMQHNLHIHMYRATTASLPYLHSCYLCSLQRVDPYPTHEVLWYLLLLTCRLQWIPTPYAWSFTHVSRSPVRINIPHVFSCRPHPVHRKHWVSYICVCISCVVKECEYALHLFLFMCLQNERVYWLLVSLENECVYSFHVYLSTHWMAFFRWYPIHCVFGGLRQTHHASLQSTLSFTPRVLIFVHTVSGASLALCHFLPRTVLCTVTSLTPCC